MGTTDRKTSGNWYIPPDHRFWLVELGFVLLVVLLAPNVYAARRTGNPALLTLGLGLGVLGAILLLVARIPLYRQRRFLTVGPRELPGVYRKLYYAAYCCLVPSIALLGALALFVR
jgi:hypothetical protein